MHLLLSWVRSSSGRRQRPRMSVGLDLGPEFVSWVVLSGAQAGAISLVCAERLALPVGWVEAGRITQPTALGLWLRQTLQQRGWVIDVLSIGVDDAWISSHHLRLAPGLSQDDVSFQLLAEVQSALPDGADVSIDYRLDPSQGPAPEVSYHVQSVPSAWVSEAQQLARAARLNLGSLMSRAHAQHLAHEQAVGEHDVAFGLALSAWVSAEFNFLPHREIAQQAARLGWLRHALAFCVAGASLALVWVVSLQTMTEALQAKSPLSEREATTRAHEAAKQTHEQLTRMAHRDHAQANWFLAQQGLQASTLAWHRWLGQAEPGVWVSHVSQKGSQWSVHGEALSSHHAQQWVRRWGELDIWAKPPQLLAVQLTPVVSQQGMPVWQFQVEAELKEVR